MSPTSYQTAPPRVATLCSSKDRTLRPQLARARCGSARRPRARPLAIPPMRVAVVDIGTNSTRLLIADVDPRHGRASQELRARLAGHAARRRRRRRAARSREEAIERVFDDARRLPRARSTQHGCEANLAVLTSAVRDAANGAEFAERVRERLRARRARARAATKRRS